MKTKVAAAVFSLSLLFTPRSHGWIEFLDGSAIPGAPWQPFVDAAGEEPGENSVIDFIDPVGGAGNQAIRLNSGVGANEWYIGAFESSEVTLAARFRVVNSSATGKENLMCVTTFSKDLAPAPSITLVDGRFKLWTYVIADAEIIDLGPVDNNWHTVYLFARSDGWTKLWWDGQLKFDNYAPLANPYDGYVEWGSGSWQFNATTTLDFDWVGYGDASDLPVSFSSTPPFWAVFQDASGGLTLEIEAKEGVSNFQTSAFTATLNGAAHPVMVTEDGAKRRIQLAGLAANQSYKAVIQATDQAGAVHKWPLEFDTFSATHFTFEAEDYNFESGQFLDTVVLASFSAPDNYLDRFGTEGIDLHKATEDPGNIPHRYRFADLVGTEYARDTLRPEYAEAQVLDPFVRDFSVRDIVATEWLNYTRTIPAGTYHLYGRLASPLGETFVAQVDRVANATTEVQTLTPLGKFEGTAGRGLETYSYVPLTGVNGAPATLTFDGQTTLRITAVDGTYRANYYMLVPAPSPFPKLSIAVAGGNVTISWEHAEGFSLESTGALPGGWAPVPNAMNPQVVPVGGGTRFYRLVK